MCWQATVLAHGVVSGEHFFDVQLQCCLMLDRVATATALSVSP
jgi:hypothetical protein